MTFIVDCVSYRRVHTMISFMFLFLPLCFLFFFFNDTATTEIYTLSLHDALPILCCSWEPSRALRLPMKRHRSSACPLDRKSTRLNSSHLGISYAVFCLKKKKKKKNIHNHKQ